MIGPMDKIIITGQHRLNGEVTVSGAKNAAVAVIPAAIIADDVCVIDNLPCIEDVQCLYNTLNNIGAKCEFLNDHTLKIDSRNLANTKAVSPDVRKIRASYYLLGAMLGRFGRAYVGYPGGCDFGVRPIDQHIKGFEALGASVSVEGGYVEAVAKDGLKADNIFFDVITVGGTMNVMLAAVKVRRQPGNNRLRAVGACHGSNMLCIGRYVYSCVGFQPVCEKTGCRGRNAYSAVSYIKAYKSFILHRHSRSCF